MSIGHKHRHTGRRPRRSYRSRFRAERHRRQRGPRDEHGPYGPGTMGGGMMSRGMMAGCSEMMHSMNAASSGRSTQSWATFLADAEALLAARLERVSLDDIARQAQPNPLHPQHG